MNSETDIKEILRKHNREVDLELAALKAENEQLKKRKPCPCLHTTPCHPRCTCVSGFSSSGCERCCTYGSPEQQKAMAEHLVSKDARIKDLETKVIRLNALLKAVII